MGPAVAGRAYARIREWRLGEFLLTSRMPGTRHRMGGTRFRVLTRGVVIGEWRLEIGNWHGASMIWACEKVPDRCIFIDYRLPLSDNLPIGKYSNL